MTFPTTILRLWIMLMSLNLSTKADVVKCRAGETFMPGGGCCRQCSPGSGVRVPCSSHNDTVCEACTFGESYSPVFSASEVCRPCSICTEYSHMVRPCNLSHDTVCRCDNNYYRDQTSRKCRPCLFCPMEYGVSQPCNKTHDRVCSRCTEGFYSDRLGTEPCKPCSRCANSQVMLEHCSPGKNTVCMDIPTTKNSPGSAVEYPETSSPGDASLEGGVPSRTNPIPIYCSVLGALVLALIVYVIVKQSRQKQLLQAKGQNLSPSNSTECPPLLGMNSTPGKQAGVMASPPYMGGAMTPTPSNVGVMPCKHGSDSGVYMDHDRPVTSTTRIRDLPPMKRKALENSMHGFREDQGGWKSLARQLGFSPPLIAGLETRAHQEGFSPLWLLLSEWGKHDNAVVGVLVQALRSIQRDDCVQILCGNSRDYLPPPSYMNLSGATQSQVI